jgi:hypothetical protein
MTEATFSIKIGKNESSCTGTEAFLSQQIPVILEYLKELGRSTEIEDDIEETDDSAGSGSKITNLAVNSIAAKMNVKSGTDLILAAVFSLTQGEKAKASRPEIIEEMKKATSYFKKSVINNLSNYLSTLIKEGKLLEQSSENYALSVGARADIESKFA